VINTNELREVARENRPLRLLSMALKAANEIDELRAALRDCADELQCVSSTVDNDGIDICLSCIGAFGCKPDCPVRAAINAANELLP
jgi:hypothetical protein